MAGSSFDFLSGTMATASYRSDYIRLTHLRRLYSGVLFLVLVLLFFGGFYTADSRNAGGFFDGLDSFLTFRLRFLVRHGLRSTGCRHYCGTTCRHCLKP